MQTALRIVPFSVVALLFTCAQTSPPQATVAIAKAASPAIVTIEAFDEDTKVLAQGSGFIVRPDGIVVTNWHVLAGAHAAKVRLSTGEEYDRVRFVEGDKDADIAILRVPAVDLPTVATTSQLPDVGAKVVVIGSPLGLTNSVSEGIVSSVRLVAGKQVVQLTAAISHGSSGGAVLDEAGKAFAIATGSLTEGQQLNFAMPVKYALGLLETAAGDRSLAEVFADEAPTRPAAKEDRRFERTASPRTGLAGAYAIDWRAPDKEALQGMLIADSRGTGVVAILTPSPAPLKSSISWSAVWISGVRTNLQGAIAFDFYGLAFDGYQTAEGFVAASDALAGGERLALRAVRMEIPLSQNSGLYDVECRTFYTHGSYQGGATDWRGEAIVLNEPEDNAVSISLWMANDVGGTTGIGGRSVLAQNSEFFIEVAEGTKSVSLKGRVRNGILDAEWIDRRGDNVQYKGNLHGERK